MSLPEKADITVAGDGAIPAVRPYKIRETRYGKREKRKARVCIE